MVRASVRACLCVSLLCVCVCVCVCVFVRSIATEGVKSNITANPINENFNEWTFHLNFSLRGI